MNNDKQRCNHCMEVFDEALTECPKCGRDDALMYPFEEEKTDPPKRKASATMNNNQAKDLVRRALLKAGLPLLTLTAKKVSMSDLGRGSVTVITVNNWTPDPRAAAIKEALPKGCGYLVQFNEGRGS